MESWMTVYNWPVFRCPQLAGFEVSPEDLRFAQTQPKSPQRQGFCHGFATVHSGWIIDMPPPSMGVQRNFWPFDPLPGLQTDTSEFVLPGHNAVSVSPSFRILFRQCGDRFVGTDL